ncbi:Threonine/homoserine/homoserine lactone efflux protein [Rhizobiales bacterium GAS191]|nr:Threonine/homoserine/homoserine lactone efflux protein [Rhizobiales bacterium GAS113]SEC06089.1 Threonine/homoserine/homoserine lactone efflux protein [Rhizobiales bacterium GAS191]SED13693.1 Threonine/homoserine/homoserine lactone efflux protein [Rhizobiales bacterium GAS188]
MSVQLYLAFVAATVILILIPGPNVALIVANSVAHGSRYGLITVAGTSSAVIIQLLLTVGGMTTFLTVMANWFEWLRWIGVAYLIYLGIRAWRAPPVDLTQARPEPRSARAIYLRGFLVSLANPKTLLFYGAFFPQFVSVGGDLTSQLTLLALTFLFLAVTLDGSWALLAGRFRAVLAVNGKLRNRLTGSLLIGAGAGLALARRS